MKTFLAKLGKTEFWLSVLTVVGLVLTSVINSNVLPAEWAGVASAIVTVAYTLSRGIAKKGQDSSTPDVPKQVVVTTRAPGA